MHAMVGLLATKPQWVPLVVVLVVLVVARLLRPGLALAALLGAAVAAGGMAGVLLGEKLLFVISVPQAHDPVKFVGVWRALLPLLAAMACAVPVTIRWHGVRRLQHVDTILAGAALFLLGTAWVHPLLK